MEGKEKYIKEKFLLEDDVVYAISEIGRNLSTNKYNVWIAKECKKNLDVINRYQDISDIIDWVRNENVDIMPLSFDEAKEKQYLWHKDIVEFKKIKDKIETQEIDNDRVIFISSNGKYFFYLLKESDLNYETQYMEHCVGNDPLYKEKISKEKSLIISLRDDNNIPHATIEIDIQKGKSLQIRGKNNQDLSKNLNKIISEFVLFASGYENLNNKHILEKINNKLLFF